MEPPGFIIVRSPEQTSTTSTSAMRVSTTSTSPVRGWSNVNLSEVAITDANISGLTIFGYDVEGWLKEQLAKDGCHND